jgi:hypothetical protein
MVKLMMCRKHVFNDLRPYVCLVKDCTAPDYTFARRHDWVMHEYDHNKEWSCILCSQAFTARLNLEQHIQLVHYDVADKHQLDRMTSMGAKSLTSIINVVCPLCREVSLSSKEYQSHVGRHQQDLALFSLPNLPAEYVEDGSDLDHEASATSNDTASVASEHMDATWEQSGILNAPAKIVDDIPVDVASEEHVPNDEAESKNLQPRSRRSSSATLERREGSDARSYEFPSTLEESREHDRPAGFKERNQIIIDHEQLREADYRAAELERERIKKIEERDQALYKKKLELAQLKDRIEREEEEAKLQKRDKEWKFRLEIEKLKDEQKRYMDQLQRREKFLTDWDKKEKAAIAERTRIKLEIEAKEREEEEERKEIVARAEQKAKEKKAANLPPSPYVQDQHQQSGNFQHEATPTYIKVHKNHVDIETLKYFKLPWEYDVSLVSRNPVVLP